MDTLTHAALGSLLALALPRRLTETPDLSRPRICLVASSAALFPDIDYALFWIDPLDFLAYWHRGLTHSLLLLPLWAAMVAGIWSAIWRQQSLWLPCFLIAGLGIFSHVAADLSTTYGTRVWAPLSQVRLTLDAIFVIDPVFSAVTVFALLICLRRKAPAIARRGLFLLMLYVGCQSTVSHYARSLADNHGRALGLRDFDSHALPQPGSPAYRLIVVQAGEDYWLARINLLAPPLYADRSSNQQQSGTARDLEAGYSPYRKPRWQNLKQFGGLPENAPVVQEVWQHPEFRAFRDFARLPVIYRLTTKPEMTCVWFTDLRYLWPSLKPPFVFGMCRSGSSAWQRVREDFW